MESIQEEKEEVMNQTQLEVENARIALEKVEKRVEALETNLTSLQKEINTQVGTLLNEYDRKWPQLKILPK